MDAGIVSPDDGVAITNSVTQDPEDNNKEEKFSLKKLRKISKKAKGMVGTSNENAIHLPIAVPDDSILSAQESNFKTTDEAFFNQTFFAKTALNERLKTRELNPKEAVAVEYLKEAGFGAEDARNLVLARGYSAPMHAQFIDLAEQMPELVYTIKTKLENYLESNPEGTACKVCRVADDQHELFVGNIAYTVDDFTDDELSLLEALREAYMANMLESFMTQRLYKRAKIFAQNFQDNGTIITPQDLAQQLPAIVFNGISMSDTDDGYELEEAMLAESIGSLHKGTRIKPEDRLFDETSPLYRLSEKEGALHVALPDIYARLLAVANRMNYEDLKKSKHFAQPHCYNIASGGHYDAFSRTVLHLED